MSKIYEKIALANDYDALISYFCKKGTEMLLEFKINNYKSFRNEASFTMSSQASKLKSDNIHTVQNDKRQKFRVSKASVIYGANASGKSNLIKALAELVSYIVSKPSVDSGVKICSPFAFDVSSILEGTTRYELHFLGPGNVKFEYKVEVSKKRVLDESLHYFPEARKKLLFKRISSNYDPSMVEQHMVENKLYTIFSNQLLLSKFGDEPHDILSDVYLYFRRKFNVNVTSSNYTEKQRGQICKLLLEKNDLKDRLTQLLRAADTKIHDINIQMPQESNDTNVDLVTKVQNTLNRTEPIITYSHDLYQGDDIFAKGGINLYFHDESRGSQTLFTVGTHVLNALDNGQIIVVDELDNSLHPFATKLLVMLFLSSKINKNGAQLIFNTHDVTLLDEHLFRKDQIWFVEKNERGESDLYSLSDFDGLREDTPFEKWYMAGKFGGLPSIQEIEKIFSNEPTA